MPLSDQTLREESATASTFVLLLQAMGISWNSHHHVIFQRLAITTEQHISHYMCIPPPLLYVAMIELDIGVDKHQQQRIIIEILTRLTYLRYYLQTCLELPTDSRVQMTYYTYSLFCDQGFQPSLYQWSFLTKESRFLRIH
jgi:hypothetical protein